MTDQESIRSRVFPVEPSLHGDMLQYLKRYIKTISEQTCRYITPRSNAAKNVILVLNVLTYMTHISSLCSM